MTTVVDPAGTPVPIFTRSGTTIVEVLASGTTQGSGALIPNASGYTVAVCKTDNNGGKNAVVLPTSAEIGDLVEIHAVALPATGGVNLFVFPPSGETIDEGAANAAAGWNGPYSRLFRKMSATGWRVVGAL